ncbi:MAG TPA: TIGR01458 family HAD-type hydrolase [Methylovorus sp.]|nr:TIGR01458 family HAD-type hydrolase [Methylovorus sp.]
MEPLNAIKGVLFDLDGVLYIGGKPVEGAVDAVERIRNAGLPCRFVTNTSTLSLASLQAKLAGLGFIADTDEIISATQAARLYLMRQGDPVCRFLLADDVMQDFADFRQSDTDAEYIVIGDIGDAWSYRLLNEVFNCLMRGAKLIAIHKNRYWQTEHGLQMDIGAFITGLEYASGVQTTLMGKPSADFFAMALISMGVAACDAVLIGDDIDADIAGAQQAGLHGVLVQTGKYRQAYCEASSIHPDRVIPSIRDFPGLLGL